MSSTWTRELLHLNAKIVAADADVTAGPRSLRVLHREGRDKAKVAGQLVTDLKRLLRLRDLRDRHLQSKSDSG